MSLHHNIFFLLALLIPLSIDAFVLSTALGMAGLPKKDRNRTSLILAAFEAGMPAIGVLLGHGLDRVIGSFSGYIAAIVIGIAGILMLKAESESKDEQRFKLLSHAKGWTIINLGISISLDELAIGLSLGILHISLLFVVIYIAIQGFIASRLGMWLGGRLNDKMRSNAERVGGIVLVVIAMVLIILRAGGHQF